jgi:hypothetical protein
MQFTYISTKHPMTTSLCYLHSTPNGQDSDKRHQPGAYSGKQNAADKHSLKNKYTCTYHVFVNKAFPFIKLGEPFSLSG